MALAGCTDIDLVVTGKYTILDLGPLNSGKPSFFLIDNHIST